MRRLRNRKTKQEARDTTPVQKTEKACGPDDKRNYLLFLVSVRSDVQNPNKMQRLRRLEDIDNSFSILHFTFYKPNQLNIWNIKVTSFVIWGFD